MDYLLDILTGIGIAVAAGLSPFLPLAVVALAGLAKLGTDYDGTSFSFLDSPVVLVLAIVLAVAAIVARRRLETPRAEQGIAVVSVVVGALACAAVVADRSGTWWPGLVAGALAALVGAAGSSSLLRRTRARLDEDTRTTLAVGAAAGAAVLALLSLVPVVGLVVLLAAIVLLVRGRRRDQQKHAGLRVLR